MEPKEIKEIFSGFKNLVFKDKEVEASAILKLEKCYSCPLRDQYICSRKLEGEVVKDFIYNGERRYKGEKVNGCGCVLEAKTRSTSQCPLGKF